MTMPSAWNNRWEARDVGGASFAIGTEGTNAITTSIQLLDTEGRAMQKRCSLRGYISSDANGDVIEAVSATLTITLGTDGVIMLGGAANVVGHHDFQIVSESDGDMDLIITQTSGADTHYIVLILPNGDLVVSPAIVFAA